MCLFQKRAYKQNRQRDRQITLKKAVCRCVQTVQPACPLSRVRLSARHISASAAAATSISSHWRPIAASSGRDVSSSCRCRVYVRANLLSAVIAAAPSNGTRRPTSPRHPPPRIKSPACQSILSPGRRGIPLTDLIRSEVAHAARSRRLENAADTVFP